MSVPAKPEMLRALARGNDSQVGVSIEDRLISGYVVAELGEFKDKRGAFDANALDRIVELGNASERGLRSRLSHPNESDDGLTKHLGRSKNFRRDGDKVRADLHIAQIAMDEPVGGGKPIGLYAMELAQEDPGALGSSLVLRTEKLERMGPDGERLPPLWTPTELFASDLVADGDAVHGDLLSADALEEFMEGSDRRIPTKLATVGAQFLDRMFPESDRSVVAERFDAFKTRYLTRRFGTDETLSLTNEEPTVDQEVQQALAETNARIDELAKKSAESAKLQSDALAAQTDALAKLTEKLGTDLDARAKAAEAQLRAAEISALCQQANYPNPTALIANDKLSVEGAKEVVAAWKTIQSDQGLSSNGDGDMPPADPLAKLRVEASEKKEQLKKAGYKNPEDWVRHQCRDKGIAYKPA